MMTSGQESMLVLGIVVLLAGVAWCWFSNMSRKIKEDEFNQEIRQKLEKDRKDFERDSANRTREFEQSAANRTRELEQSIANRTKEFEQTVANRNRELERRAKYLDELRASFNEGYLGGRKWLADFVAEADRAFDQAVVDHLRNKKRPAIKAAEEVAAAQAERRVYKERAKFLEYQLVSYKEYFPFLDEYEGVILEEAVPLTAGLLSVEALEDSDPVLRFVPKTEYDRLSSAERNQLALDRYLSGSLSPIAIGRLYERYIGYLYEQEGWTVEYHGIVKGMEDLGRDLICSRGNEVHIVQVKCWSKVKVIHEKHIFQLFGTTQLYLMARDKTDLFSPNVKSRFITSTSLSPVARQAAEWLEIGVQEGLTLDKSFPMIKCNINQSTLEKIYHLPFDQQYDRTKIVPALGECYVAAAAQAEKLGFRRAFRFSGTRSDA